MRERPQRRLSILIVLLLIFVSLSGCIGQVPNNGGTDGNNEPLTANEIKMKALAALRNVSNYKFDANLDLEFDPRPVSFFIISYDMPKSSTTAQISGAVDMKNASIEMSNSVQMDFFNTESSIAFNYSIANNETFGNDITKLMGLADGLSFNNQDILNVLLGFFEDSAVSLDETKNVAGDTIYVLSIDDADPKELYDTLGTTLLTNITGSVGFMGFIQNFMTAMIEKYIKTTSGTFKLWVEKDTWLIKKALFDSDIYSRFDGVKATGIPLIGSMTINFEVDMTMSAEINLHDFNAPTHIDKTAISDILISTSMFPSLMENAMSSDLAPNAEGWDWLNDTTITSLDLAGMFMVLSENITLEKSGQHEFYQITISTENGELNVSKAVGGNESLAARSFFTNNRFIEALTTTMADPKTAITMEMNVGGTATIKIKQTGKIDLTYYIVFGSGYTSIERMYGGGTMSFDEGDVTNQLTMELESWSTPKSIVIPMS